MVGSGLEGWRLRGDMVGDMVEERKKVGSKVVGSKVVGSLYFERGRG
jgi:hypothetical protein